MRWLLISTYGRCLNPVFKRMSSRLLNNSMYSTNNFIGPLAYWTNMSIQIHGSSFIDDLFCISKFSATLLQIHSQERRAWLKSYQDPKQNRFAYGSKWRYTTTECVCSGWRSITWGKFFSGHKQGTVVISHMIQKCSSIIITRQNVASSSFLTDIRLFIYTLLEQVLAVSRVMVAWQPIGISMGIYDMCHRYLWENRQIIV